MIGNLTNVSERKIDNCGGKPHVLYKAVSIVRNCVCLVDEDPDTNQDLSQSKHRDKFTKIEEEDNTAQELQIDLFEYPERQNKLVVLKPKLELWFLDLADKAELDCIDYGIPQYVFHNRGQINNYLDEFDRMKKDLLNQSELFRLFQRKLRELAEIAN